MYYHNYLSTVLVTACLTLATFWTHALSKSRIQLGTTNLIIIILLLLFLRSRLPMAGGQLPLIGQSTTSTCFIRPRLQYVTKPCDVGPLTEVGGGACRGGGVWEV